MATIPLPDAQRLDAAPFDANSTLYRLDLTTSSASITLGSGGYILFLEDAAASAIVRVGGAASDPASGASLGAACLLQPGAAVTMTLEAQAEVHGIMRSGTGKLFACRVL